MEELNAVINQENGMIDFNNFDQLKERLLNYLKNYKGATFTEETKAIARADIADLRKLKKAINDRKIEVKKLFMQPYEEFEVKAKELMALIDEPIELIDNQVKVFEKKRIEERRVLIQEIYEEKSGDLAEYAPLDRIYSDKWERASTSTKSIKADIEQIFLGVQMDIESLRLMRVDPDVIEFALDKYKKGDTVIDSMRKANEFAELVEKRKRTEEVVCEKGTGIIGEPIPLLTHEAEIGLPFVTPSTRMVSYYIVASESEIEELEAYLSSVGISFGRID